MAPCTVWDGARAAGTKRVLELDGRHALTESPPVPVLEPWPRRKRWVVGITAGLLLAAALSWAIADQVSARQHFDRTHSALAVTQHQVHIVDAHLAELSRDVSILKTEVGSDTTALNQDSAQLLGAQTSLSAAQAHVTQQASLITSLQTCLTGVERALNALAVGDQPGGIAALNAVSTSCAAAEAAGG
jgi:hypothetical protein